MVFTDLSAEKFVKEYSIKYGLNCGICSNDKAIYHSELIKLCESNFCGNYGKCHTCPPLVGEIEECIVSVLLYKKILVFQKIYFIQDSYDYDGMMNGKKDFDNIQSAIADEIRTKFDNTFILGAGGCMICEKCAAVDNLPCRFPEKAISSLEAYAIQVSELSALAGLKYVNGENTVTYFGGIFYDYTK